MERVEEMNKRKLLVKEFAKEMRTIDKDSKVSLAYKMLKKGKISHLIATESGRPIGIVSWKDLLWNMWDEAREGEAANLYVSSIATYNPITISANENIKKAATKMIEEEISSLPVKQGGEIVNILTKKSILEKITKFPDERVGTLMTEDVFSATEGTSINTAIHKMRENDISMFPIIEEGKLTGFVDIHGLAREMIELFINPPYRHIDSVLKRMTLGEIMKGPFGLPPEASIYAFGNEVTRKRVKGTPVLPGGSSKVIGILSETDVCKYIANLP